MIICLILYAPFYFQKAELQYPGWKGNEALWRLMDYGNTARSYFGQFEIHGAENVNKDTQYSIACHPHGTVIFQRTFWRTDLMDKIFYRPWRMLGASILFSIPIVREMSLWFGAVDASKKTCEKVLSAGASLVLYPGGLDEANTVTVESDAGGKAKAAADVALRTRTGFIRLAVKYNTPVLPVFTFGELEAVDAVNLLPSRITKWLQKRLRMSTTIFLGRFYSFIPYRVPFHMCIGRPVPVKWCPDGTPEAEIDAEVRRVHAAYKKELQAIYDANKAKYGYQDRKLVFACDGDGDVDRRVKDLGGESSHSDNKIVAGPAAAAEDSVKGEGKGEGEGEGEEGSNQSNAPRTRVSPRGRAAKQSSR